MPSAIPVGTRLQNHYKIVQLLGQGGFGRTYLAEDEDRFNERCAIKEFVPVQGEDRFSHKATELFKREASVLYQITHPQIPQFRAIFEEAEHLFLVQDYVEGPTFHAVINQRRQQGKTFSEAEIRQFLRQLLPVLAHIHAKGIIHRDISPDNVILRQQDKLPVLIDFGVVKEVVTRMQSETTLAQPTTVGKAGYAPSEQMQTGRAYPSSDLYALAVTAIVLLTGKEPQQLFDDVNFTWKWEDAAVVSPGLAQVLNKALSYRPGDRYQSVSEMAKALQANAPEADSSAVGRVVPPATPAPPVSQMKTVAVGRNQPGLPSEPTVNRPNTVRQSSGRQLSGPSAGRANEPLRMPSEQERSSVLENPLAVGGLATALVVTAGFGGWAVVRSLDQQPQQPPQTDTTITIPEVEDTPEPETVQVDPKPVEYQQPPLRLNPGVTKAVTGNMRGGDKVNYPLSAESGQTLSVAVKEESMLFTVLGPAGEPVAGSAERVAQWEGTLEESGEYRIQLSPVTGVPSSDYRLEVTLSPVPAEEPDPVELPEDPTETPNRNPDGGASDRPDERPDETPDVPDTPDEIPVQPDIQLQRISFPSGSDAMLVANNVGPGQIRRYVLNLQEGQILTTTVVEGNANFDVVMPGGELVADAAGLTMWEGFVPVGGDYSIDVSANQFSEFTLELRASSVVPTE
ncbi:MAG: protein kinase [Cyanobacteria bacterium J06554_11]